jgi:hypothetical protein
MKIFDLPMPGPIPLAQEELAEVSNYHWMENK